MPKIEIRWTSAGTPEQDEALADEIVDDAMRWLGGFDPDASVDLGAPGLAEGTEEEPT